MAKHTFNKYVATIFLVLMSVQYIPLEGPEVSTIKVAAMVLAPFIWISFSPKVSKAFRWGGLYLLVITVSILINSDTLRLTTVLYKFSFVLMFIMYYNLIYCEKAFTLNYFIKVLKGLLYAYIICLLLQQVAIIFGIRSLPVINLIGFLDRGIGANALAIEPSHTARIMTALMLVLFRMHEVKWGKGNFKISRLYKDNKWVVLGFLWAMLSMGSSTAFVGLAILSIYFMQRQYAVSIISIMVIFYFSIPSIDYEPFNRAKATFEVSLTLNPELVKETDYSAAARVTPLMYTILELDLSKKETWFGKGIDTGVSADYLSKEQTIGGISDYGLISYIISLIFVIACCIKKILSIEMLIFVLLLGAGIGNIAYIWAILMFFTTSNYFLLHAKRFNPRDLRLQ